MGFSSTQLATTSLIAQAGGGIMSAFGAATAARGSRSALEAQASMADTNARIAEISAQTALAAGQKEVANLTRKAGQLKSRQRVAMAANGIDLTSATATEILASSDLMKEEDVNTIVANSARNAWGYRMVGVNSTNDALMKRAAADAISPTGAAVGTLFSSAAGVASNWYALNKAGAFDNNEQRSTPPSSGLTVSKNWW